MIVVQIKGLAKEGKTAIAQALAALLNEYGMHVECYNEGYELRPDRTIGDFLKDMGKRKTRIIIATKEVKWAK